MHPLFVPSRRPCGTTLGSRFVVRATGTSPTSTITSARPGYLYAIPTIRFNTFVPYARLTSDLNAASIFTLDETNGCALTDITNGGAAVRASYTSATNAQSVTVEGTNAQALSTGLDFLPYQCTADVTGLLSCRVLTVDLNVYTYSPGTSAGVTVSVCQNASPKYAVKLTTTQSPCAECLPCYLHAWRRLHFWLFSFLPSHIYLIALLGYVDL